MFYFVTAVGCFCCPRSRRLDYNITNGAGCQHYFSSFLVFFWKFLPFHQESQCLCGFAAFYIYNKISHFAEFYCIFCIFSLFLSTLFRCVLHLWQHLFYNRTSCKALSITPRDFLFLQKAKKLPEHPRQFFLLFFLSIIYKKSLFF